MTTLDRVRIRGTRKHHAESTRMVYQVETDQGVHESMCQSLAEALKLAGDLKKKGLTVRVSRYDRSGWSDYYEMVVML